MRIDDAQEIIDLAVRGMTSASEREEGLKWAVRLLVDMLDKVEADNRQLRGELDREPSPAPGIG
ncbi:MAG: hypothetical protein AAFS08_13070 [Pseudomonadota bacterium]